MSGITAFGDPYAQPGRGGPSTLTDVQPQGTQLKLNPDGTATVMDGQDAPFAGADHFENLAEHMEEVRLDAIATDLLEAIEQDKESRSERDRQYEEGLNRTGLGDNAPGGAAFPGASRAVHPLLTEASIDFSARVMGEMLPPDGPVKASIVGDETDAKNERAKRIARYMNWQLTELMPSAYHEFEVGFTQCPLGGAFYTKTYLDGSLPAVSFIPIDQVYRPWSDGDFYSQPRITHAQNVDVWTFKENMRKGLWRKVVEPDTAAADIPEESQSERANDRIVGRSETAENIDRIRLVYECSTIMPLESDEDEDLPYLVTIDCQTRKVLSIYRNWKETDPNRKRYPFLIEWPFWPWRGGYPIGLTHMIGSLAGAATGSLRALLDAAHLNNSQTGIQLKGGATSGGQNMAPRVTEINVMQGSLAQDDVRKTFMPLPFNPPSPTLFQLLGFLVDAGRGVVRTTFDEYDKFGGDTPVGTAQMFIEQGLKNFGAVHARLHRSMRMFLKTLYDINAATLTNETIIDQQGELTVTPQDFQGPMVVIPVSDPRIFSDLQRKAMAQTIAARAQALAPLGIYDLRAAEENFLRQYGVSEPDRFLVKIPQPQRQNAVAENVTASNGGPVKAFPGQDHEAHITLHMAFLESPVFGSNPSLAVKYLPKMVDHLGEHVALWYSDAMLEAATQALRQMTGIEDITLDSFMGEGTEVPLDQLMAELDDEVLALANEKLGNIPDAVMRARDLMKSLAPSTPMDPSVVAAEDVQRQREKDKTDSKLKLIDFQSKREEAQRKADREDRKTEIDAQLSARDQDIRAAADERRDQIAAAGVQTQSRKIESDEERNTEDNETALEITDKNNEARVDAAKEAAKNRPVGGGRGNLKNGTRINPNP